MPNRCSVPGFRSKYDGEVFTPCFQRPKNEELLREWIREREYKTNICLRLRETFLF